jgi:hypothetical protein
VKSVKDIIGRGGDWIGRNTKDAAFRPKSPIRFLGATGGVGTGIKVEYELARGEIGERNGSATVSR